MPRWHGERPEELRGACLQVPAQGRRKRDDQPKQDSSRLTKPENCTRPVAFTTPRVVVCAKGAGASGGEAPGKRPTGGGAGRDGRSCRGGVWGWWPAVGRCFLGEISFPGFTP